MSSNFIQKSKCKDQCLVMRGPPGPPGPPGVLNRPIRTVTSDYQVLITDSIILVDASSGPVVITLLSAFTIVGSPFDIKKIDSTSNEVIIAAQAGEQVEFASSISNDVQGANVSVTSNGVAWYML